MRPAGWAVVAGAIALAICAGAHGATPQARGAYKSTLRQATADYNAARAHCGTLSGHPRSVCIAEAKATLRKAEANAEAVYRDSSRARLDAELNAARADYTVDKAKCGDRSGAARKSCIAEARGRQSATMSSAMKASKAAAKANPPDTAAARAASVPATPKSVPATSSSAPATRASAPATPASAPAASAPATPASSPATPAAFAPKAAPKSP